MEFELDLEWILAQKNLGRFLNNSRLLAMVWKKISQG
jgi:hypothetical protein